MIFIFSFIHSSQYPINLFQVFEIAVAELERAHQHSTKHTSADLHPAFRTPQNQQHDFQTMMTFTLHLINLLCTLLKPTNTATMYKFKESLNNLSGLGLRGADGRSLLHLALDEMKLNVGDRSYSRFPSSKVVQVRV